MSGFDLAQHLRDRGTDPEQVAAAEAEGIDAVRRLAQDVVLLGGPPDRTAADVVAEIGTSDELARTLWRAMGFAELPDDAVALTEADVGALGTIATFLRDTGVSEEMAVRFTRLLGQSMSRVADALLSITDQGLSEIVGLPDADVEDLMPVTADLITPLIERELVYLLRRHLHAGALRRLAADGDHRVAVVGFADVVSFTRLSGQLPEEDLAELLESFEATTSDVITDAGGRVVKLIGDAVLFTTDAAEAGAELALRLVEAFGGDQPELRVGMTMGQVISRQGDVFGPTVNLASRLVGYARPGTVVVDDRFVAALGDAPGWHTKPMRPRELKGIGVTPLHVLRRHPRSAG